MQTMGIAIILAAALLCAQLAVSVPQADEDDSLITSTEYNEESPEPRLNFEPLIESWINEMLEAQREFYAETRLKFNEIQSSQEFLINKTTELHNDVKNLKEKASQIQQTSEAIPIYISWVQLNLDQKWETLDKKLAELQTSQGQMHLKMSSDVLRKVSSIKEIFENFKKPECNTNQTSPQSSKIATNLNTNMTNNNQTSPQSSKAVPNLNTTNNDAQLNSLIGRIQSPNHQTGLYAANTNMSWTLVAPKDHKIRFTIEFMDLEGSELCEFDFLEATEGDGTRLLKRCGRQYRPSEIISTSNQVEIRFKTDHSAQFTGFSLFYESFQEVPQTLIPIITFYNGENFYGPSIPFTITENRCYVFPAQFRNTVSSVNTGDRCIKLFLSRNCNGPQLRLYPGGRLHHNQLPESFDDKTQSFSSCLFEGNETESMSVYP